MDQKVIALTSSRERAASTRSGYLMFVLLLAIAVAGAFLIYSGVQSENDWLAGLAAWVAGIVIVVIGAGFYMLQPNQAAAITLFGNYRGTDRLTGLRWVWPWMMRKKVSVRANNFISERIKVNDLRGNPIEMAAQIVLRVVDTSQALFDVDDYREFVKVQVEAAVRAIGARYPYDDFEHQEVTLRGNHDEVGAELRQELIARLAVAGIAVENAGSRIWPMHRKSPVRCFAVSRRRRSLPPARRSLKVPSEWSNWRLSSCPRKMWSNWTMSGARRWFPT